MGGEFVKVTGSVSAGSSVSLSSRNVPAQGSGRRYFSCPSGSVPMSRSAQKAQKPTGTGFRAGLRRLLRQLLSPLWVRCSVRPNTPRSGSSHGFRASTSPNPSLSPARFHTPPPFSTAFNQFHLHTAPECHRCLRDYPADWGRGLHASQSRTTGIAYRTLESAVRSAHHCNQLEE